MKAFRLPILVAISASFGVQGSLAADMSAPRLYTKAPLQAVVPPLWTGLYVGADIGAGWTQNTGTWNPLPTSAAFGANGTSAGTGGTGAIGGAHIGYNWQLSRRFVTGVEADWSWSHIGGSYSQTWTANPGNAPVAGSFTNMGSTMNWVGSARLRGGFLVTPDLLAYATGGVAWAQIGYSGANSNGNAGNLYSTTISQTSIQAGYVVGGGLEWALSRNWSVRGEYLYYRFGQAPSILAQSANFPTFPSSYSWNATALQVARVGVSYKF